jgi:hypothetical protein
MYWRVSIGKATRKQNSPFIIKSLSDCALKTFMWGSHWAAFLAVRLARRIATRYYDFFVCHDTNGRATVFPHD